MVDFKILQCSYELKRGSDVEYDRSGVTVERWVGWMGRERHMVQSGDSGSQKLFMVDWTGQR